MGRVLGLFVERVRGYPGAGCFHQPNSWWSKPVSFTVSLGAGGLFDLELCWAPPCARAGVCEREISSSYILCLREQSLPVRGFMRQLDPSP